MQRLFENQNKLEEAEVHARAAWEVAKKGNLGVPTVSRLGDLISLLDKRKKYEEASRVADDLWQALSKTKWPGEPPLLRSELLNRIASLHEHWHGVAPSEERVKAIRLWRERSAKVINWDRNVRDDDFHVMMLFQAWWMPTLLEEGHPADYKKERTRLLQRVKHTTHPGIAEKATRAALLLPAEGDELRQAVALADLAMQKMPEGEPGLPAASKLAKGLALYRTGKFAEAITALDPALSDTTAQMWFATVAVLAMSHEHLGHHPEAMALLDKAAKANPTQVAALESKVRRDEGGARLLLAEAMKLIKP